MRKLTMLVPAVLVAGLMSYPALGIAKGKDDTKPMSKQEQQEKNTKEKQKINDAEAVLTAAVSAPDKGIPKELLEKAECVGVFPGVKKAAFVVGGEGGKGVFTCRTNKGAMSPPAFFNMGGPSIGWQVGVEEADIVLLVMNPEGTNKLLMDKFKIGVDASAAAGPVGRNTQASTDILMHSQILSWSRARGLFAGISLDGMVVKQDTDDNQALYGKPVQGREILLTPQVPVPQIARSFINTAEQYTKRAS
jgi:lipid-binding SYLF domain-containing protein